jgi:hypothetical protein
MNEIIEADFEDIIYRFDLHSKDRMTYSTSKGKDLCDKTVSYKRFELKPNVYIMFWQDDDRTTVTHIEDHEKKLVYANITTKDNEFFNLKGILKIN